MRDVEAQNPDTNTLAKWLLNEVCRLNIKQNCVCVSERERGGERELQQEAARGSL